MMDWENGEINILLIDDSTGYPVGYDRTNPLYAEAYWEAYLNDETLPTIPACNMTMYINTTLYDPSEVVARRLSYNHAIQVRTFLFSKLDILIHIPL